MPGALSRVLKRCWLVAVCLLCFCRAAQAQDSPYRVRYQAPRACPGADEFARRVQERSEHGRPVLDQSLARTMRVTIRREPHQYRANLEFYDLGARAVARELEAPDCEALVDALVLVTALAIDAQVPQAPYLPGVELPDHFFASGWPPLEAEPVPLMVLPPRSSLPPLRRRFTAVGAMGRVNTAAVPGLGGGALLFVQLPRSLGEPLIELGASWGMGRSSSNGERARIDWLTAVAAFCPVAVDLGRGVELLPCAGLEAGALVGSGERSPRITYPERRATDWLAFFLLAHLRIPMTPLLRLEMKAGPVVPATRPAFEFNTPTLPVFRPPWVGLMTGIGIAFELE